jgi:hypothetical protein
MRRTRSWPGIIHETASWTTGNASTWIKGYELRRQLQQQCQLFL